MSIKNEEKAIKLDADKLRMDLIPPIAINEMAKILTFGSKKYNDRNWEKGLPLTRLLAAVERHLLSWKMGIDVDAESNESHLSHALTNLAMMIHLQNYKKEECDDRIIYNAKK
jgi:hypothetical protein